MSKIYVVAGGSKGIGLQLVERLQSEGNQVFVLSRQMDGLKISNLVTHQSFDFLNDDPDQLVLPEVIHGVAYCPGTINLKSFRSLKIDDFRSDLETNLLGAVKLLQACYANLKKGSVDNPASVVLFSTVAVQTGMPMHSSVSAAKGAIEGLARSLAAEWAPQVRVNCIAPALTETPLAERFFKSEEMRESLAAKYPLKRTGIPDDIASMACFLLGQQSDWITGQVMKIDGGMSSLAGK